MGLSNFANKNQWFLIPPIDLERGCELSNACKN